VIIPLLQGYNISGENLVPVRVLVEQGLCTNQVQMRGDEIDIGYCADDQAGKRNRLGIRATL